VLAVSFARQNVATGLSQQELTVTEFYKQKQEDNTVKLLKDYWKGAPHILSPTYSSFADDNMPEVVSETYIMPFGVKAMAFTETANHISAQNIMLVTTNNMVYNLIHRMYTARRPLKGGVSMTGAPAPAAGYFDAPAAEDEEEEGDDKDGKNKKKPLKLKSLAYPNYDPVQPLFNTNYVSYDLELSDLRSINTYPTKLESTS